MPRRRHLTGLRAGSIQSDSESSSESDSEGRQHPPAGQGVQRIARAPARFAANTQGPDEDCCQDQGEEDQQPGIVWRQHPQGQHGGGGGSRAGARPGRNRYALCVFASCWIARFLSGLLKQVGDFMQTLHSREKVCM
jgi:hypothetical protein